MPRAKRLANRLKLLAPLKSHPWLVVLDFDRTLFDTGRYYADMLDMVGRHYGPDLVRQMRLAESKNAHFDPFGFLSEHKIPYDQATASFQTYYKRKYRPTNGIYLYPDAAELIRTLRQRRDTTLKIVTTGTPGSQRLKLGLCPELKGIPAEVISGNKGVKIQRELDNLGSVHHDGNDYLRIMLVDDRESVLSQMKSHSRHRLLVHIVRPGAKYQPNELKPGIRRVSSLLEVLAFF